MQIFVKDPEGKTIVVDVDPTEPVSELRRKIGERFPGIASTALLIGEKYLKDDVRLCEYSVQNGTTVYSAVPLRGG